MASSPIRSGSADLWRYRLERPVGGSGVSAVDLIVVTLEDGDGETGSGFSYVLSGPGDLAVRAARHMIATELIGHPLVHPEATHRRLKRSLNRTGKGASYIGLAALDVALWDLYAKRLALPLGAAMGGSARAVKVYGSGGFSAGQDPEAAAAQAGLYLDAGVAMVKPRVTASPADRQLLDRVRRRLGDSALMAIDANEKGTASSASWLVQASREYHPLFIEEPLPAHDLGGYRMLARSDAAIATGEHLQGLDDALPFIAEGLCRVMQPDLAMMGGLTECLRVARVAEAMGIEIAPHFLPNLFVHLAAAAPNVTWLEDFPLIEPLFGSPPSFDNNGLLTMPDAPGHGLSWAPGAIDHRVALS